MYVGACTSNAHAARHVPTYMHTIVHTYTHSYKHTHTHARTQIQDQESVRRGTSETTPAQIQQARLGVSLPATLCIQPGQCRLGCNGTTGHNRAVPRGHDRAQQRTTGQCRLGCNGTTGHNRARQGTTGQCRLGCNGTTGHNRAVPRGHDRAVQGTTGQCRLGCDDALTSAVLCCSWWRGAGRLWGVQCCRVGVQASIHRGCTGGWTHRMDTEDGHRGWTGAMAAASTTAITGRETATPTSTHTHTYIYIHLHTHTHIYIHSHTHNMYINTLAHTP